MSRLCVSLIVLKGLGDALMYADMPERSAMSASWHIERDYLNLMLTAEF
jgi:hypothetical protein